MCAYYQWVVWGIAVPQAYVNGKTSPLFMCSQSSFNAGCDFVNSYIALLCTFYMKLYNIISISILYTYIDFVDKSAWHYAVAYAVDEHFY